MLSHEFVTPARNAFKILIRDVQVIAPEKPTFWASLMRQRQEPSPTVHLSFFVHHLGARVADGALDGTPENATVTLRPLLAGFELNPLDQSALERELRTLSALLAEKHPNHG